MLTLVKVGAHMPFFKRNNPQEIKSYCQENQLEDLRLLNRQYGNFFTRIAEEELLNKEKITLLNQHINEIQMQIDAQTKHIEYRQQALDNLSRDVAEAVCSVNSTSSDNRPFLENQLAELCRQKSALELRNNWISSERHECMQELEIIKVVIEEKKQAAKSESERSGLKM
jgi:hypothetical protein